MFVLIRKVKLKVSMFLYTTSCRRIEDEVNVFLFVKPFACVNEVQQTKHT